jgi:hypothetical protein
MKKFFRELISDDNQINEQAFVGVISFFAMVFVLLVDVATGIWSKELIIKEFIFDYRYIYINNNYELYYLVDIEQYNYIINILKDSNLNNKLILINKIKSIEEKFDDFNNLTNKLADEIDNKYKIIDKFTIESELFTENSNKKIKLYSYFYDMISNKVEKKDYKKKIIESKIFNFKKINEKFNEICLHFEINFDNVEIIDYKSLNVYLDNVYIYYIYVLRIKELYKFLLLLKNKEDLNSIYNIIKAKDAFLYFYIYACMAVNLFVYLLFAICIGYCLAVIINCCGWKIL